MCPKTCGFCKDNKKEEDNKKDEMDDEKKNDERKGKSSPETFPFIHNI